jgi:hypothetical protein
MQTRNRMARSFRHAVPKLFAAGDAISRSLPWGEQRLRTERLLERAGAKGDVELTTALQALATSLETEASLSLFGTVSARWDITRLLRNFMRMQQEESRDGSIRAERIERPVFITGLPRSGTSFLHNLLAEDPDTLVPRFWQLIYPYPHRRRADRRPQQAQSQLDMFAAFAPDFAGIHPFRAHSPQECTDITAHVFRSLRFDTTHHVPGYRSWLRAEGHLLAYRFHKRFLQHLQRQAGDGPRQWVLKAPEHVFALEAIREVYPDALIVYVHRDPLLVLSSVAFMTEVLRRPFTRRVDRAAIGRQVAQDWAEGARLIVADSETASDVAHVFHSELIADPLETVRRLMQQLGRALSAEAERRMRTRVGAAPKGGYQHLAYRPEDYGIDLARERSRFAGYTSFFDIRTAEV